MNPYLSRFCQGVSCPIQEWNVRLTLTHQEQLYQAIRSRPVLLARRKRQRLGLSTFHRASLNYM